MHNLNEIKKSGREESFIVENNKKLLDLRAKLLQLNEEYLKTQTEIAELLKSVDNFIGENKNLEEIKPKTEVKPEVNKIESNYQTIGYADVILDEKIRMRGVSTSPTEDTVYEILKDANGSLKLTVYQGSIRRVLKNPAFVDGCEKKQMSLKPTNIDVKYGSLRKNDEGGYDVIERPVVLFID